MTDKAIRHLTTAAVLLVAAIAAVVSYQHLYHLAVTHGETRMDSALIPLSIDGTVVTASLLMLRAARLGLPTPWLARCMLAVAVIMTVAANVAFGWQYAIWGILIAGWPAAAFLMNAESSISFGRKTHPAAESDTVTAVTPEPVPVAEPVTMAPVVVEELNAAVATMTVKQRARLEGVSERTMYRRLAMANGNGKAHG